MKIRMVLLLRLFCSSLFIFIFLCIAKIFMDRSIVDQNAQKPRLQPQRRSVTLQEENSTFHLNYSAFLLQYPHLQNYRCSVLHTPGLTHDPLMPVLLLAIKSQPSFSGRRSVLRMTWAKDMVVEGYRLRTIFLLAVTDSVGYMNIVEKESQQYNDILQWDFMEGHHNLSLKERCFLEWLHFNMPNVDYIFKGDDDEFVNPAAMVRYIKEHGTPRTLHGAVQRHGAVFRHSKYQVSDSLFPYSRYPCFLSGGGFLFPVDSVPPLYLVSQNVPVFPLDDVYLGFLILAANLSMIDDSRFYVWGLQYDPCDFQQAFVVHRVHPELMVRIWREIQEAKCDSTKASLK